MFSKMSALTLSFEVSSGGGSGRSSGRSRRRAGSDKDVHRGGRKSGSVHRVQLDLGTLKHDPLRAVGIWNKIKGSVDTAEPWSLDIRRATPETVWGLESAFMRPAQGTSPFIGAELGVGLNDLSMQHLVAVSLRSGRGFGDEGARALASALRDAVPHLRTLNLSGNDLGPKAAEALAGALLGRRGSGDATEAMMEDENQRAGMGCALEELDLAGNHIGSEGACVLADALVQVGCPRLRKLDLSQNLIGARGVAALSEVLRGQALRGQAVGLGSFDGGSVHRRHRCGFALEELSLRHNGCGDAGVRALAFAITEAVALRRPHRSSTAAPPLDENWDRPLCLRALRLGFNGITSVGAAALAAALSAAREAAHTSLGSAAATAAVVTELDLACNSLGPEGARAVLDAAEGVEDLDLGNNGIKDDGMKWVSRALKENTTLRRLCLAGNDVGPDGAWWIADALAVNGDLRSLDLGANAVGDEGAKDIAEELRVNTALHTLDLRRNGIGADGARELAEALEENESMTCVTLRGNGIPEAAARDVRNKLGLRIDVEWQAGGRGR